MDLALTDTERRVRDAARRYAQHEIAPRAAQADREGRVERAVLRGLAELGLIGVNVPRAYGGAEAGVVAYSLALTEVARACASTAVTMAVTNMVCEVIARYGSETQRARHLPALCSGRSLAGAFALSEPDAGSDPGSMRTEARRDGTAWVLEGTKQWITSGDFADVLVVWARTGGPGPRGLSAFVVERGTEGLHVGSHEDKLGLRGSSTVGLRFEGCRVGDEALLGEREQGFGIAMTALDGGRIGVASQALGIAEAALGAAVDYARQREQLGQARPELSAIEGMIADSTVEVSAARDLALRAAWLKQRGRPFTQQAAIAKVYASEAAYRVCDRALQIHGGHGYTREYPVERYFRDVRVTQIYEGTSQIQRIVIARSLLR